MATEAFDPSTRLALLERETREMRRRIDSNGTRLNAVEVTQSVAGQVSIDTRDDVLEVKTTVNRILWAIVGMAFTIAGFAIEQVITAVPH